MLSHYCNDTDDLRMGYLNDTCFAGGSSGTLDQHRVSALLAASGLGKEALAIIWRTVITTQSGLTPIGFYLALALVAAVQVTKALRSVCNWMSLPHVSQFSDSFFELVLN